MRRAASRPPRSPGGAVEEAARQRSARTSSTIINGAFRSAPRQIMQPVVFWRSAERIASAETKTAGLAVHGDAQRW
jgi:hypothetical protein